MKATKVIKGRYADSITLMLIAEELKKQRGVSDAVMNMATPANIDIMREGGFQIDLRELLTRRYHYRDRRRARKRQSLSKKR